MKVYMQSRSEPVSAGFRGGLDNTSLKFPWCQTFSQFSMMTHMGGSVRKEHVTVGAADDHREYFMNTQPYGIFAT